MSHNKMSLEEAVIKHQTGFLKSKDIDVIDKDDEGYLKDFQHNLIEPFSNWDKIQTELGNELKGKEGKPAHFLSVRSSSALCVNNFAPFKEHCTELSFLVYSGFKEAQFEKKQPTGLGGTPPHLDFYLSSPEVIIGVESKFTEHFGKKKPNHNDNLKPYLDGWETLKNHFSDISVDFRKNILEHYAGEGNKSQYLDVAQLIKHTIGLLNNCGKKEAVLVYLYWEPLNPTIDNLFAENRHNIEMFKHRIEQFIEFVPLSYPEFWKQYENDALLKDHFSKVKERYGFEMKTW